MQITRIANLTGLDVVGLPVVQACRPNARSNAVSQGKGLDLDSARASAIMEVVETFHAERILRPVRFGSAAELAGCARLVDVGRLPRLARSRYHSHLDMLWISGEDLASGEEVWLPYETVHARFKAPYPSGSGCFPLTTNGLASGNTRLEAIVHGLCEVIERDALAVIESEPGRLRSARLDLASVDDPDAKRIIDRFDEVGIAIGVWDVTSDVGVPAFCCRIMERADGPGLLSSPVEGSGCHPERSVALLRAVTEAAQARVTVISGARDDVAPAPFAPDDATDLEAELSALSSGHGERKFAAVANRPSPSFDEDVRWLVRRLQDRGVTEIAAVDLTADGAAPYAVVRVVVPGLAGIPDSDRSPAPGTVRPMVRR